MFFRSSSDQRLKNFIVIFNSFTILLWGWFALEFFTRRETLVPPNLGNIYLIALAFYAGDKEIRRWRHDHRSKKQRGEYIVMAWVAAILIMVMIEIFGGFDYGYRVPKDMPLVVGSVVVIFFLTQYLKTEFENR